jgi:hypothetical protein
MIKTQVVQATSGLHDDIIKAVLDIPKHIVHDAEDFDATNTVFNPDAFAGNGGVLRSFFGGQFTPFGFLLGLERWRVSRFIALKTGILPQLTVGWKVKVLLVRRSLIVFLTFTSATQPFDFLGAFVSNHIVFDGMLFLFAAVVLLLVRYFPLRVTPVQIILVRLAKRG